MANALAEAGAQVVVAARTQEQMDETVKQIRDAGGDEPLRWGPMLVGAATAAVVGTLVIRGFLAFVQHQTLDVFVWYRIALGLVTMAAIVLGVL